MNELQRQAYLSALGIENYMPRWQLPCAPQPIACILPTVNVESVPAASFLSPGMEFIAEASVSVAPVIKVEPNAADMLGNLDVRQKPAAPINAASILQQLEEKKTPVIAPFSLSLWRPTPGFLIIDSRNTALALPTELLLSNILRAVIGAAKPDLNEEVLRWPMIENRFVSRTEADARNELQTWLAVENELRPINRLWLLGENASQYFVATGISVLDCRWQKVAINGSAGQNTITALLLPSLIELLQNPTDKARLWAAID